MPPRRAGSRELRRGDSVDAGGSAAVERPLLGGRGAGRDALEGVPQLGVAAGLLVRREVALEHAALGAERLDARLEIHPPCGGEVLGRRRYLALGEIEAERGHADAAELDVDVRAFRQLGDVLLPANQ